MNVAGAPVMSRSLLLLVVACAEVPASDDDAHTDADTAPDLPRCGGLDAPCAAITRAEVQTCGAGLTWEGTAVPWPERMSDLGCLHGPALEPGPDLVPYGVASPLWTQGSHKLRWVVVPPGATVAFTEDDEWGFPVGSMIVKQFDHDVVRAGGAVRTPIEIRYMLRTDAGWAFATYRWDAGATDGVLAHPEGEVVPVTVRVEGRDRDLGWRIPGVEECTTCHRDLADEALGLRSAQLDTDVVYDGLVANQLVAWWTAGLLDRRPVGDWARLADPYGKGPVEARARSWLHGNCSHCHRPGGFVSPEIFLDLRASTPLAESHACEGSTSGFGRRPAIVPGDPEASEIVRRIEETGFEKMPPDGAVVADADGLKLVRRWIGGMEGCE